MSDKKPKGVPYGYSSTPEKSSGPRTGVVVIGIAVAVVVIAGIVAMVLTLAAGLGLLPACWLSERVRKRHGLLRFHGILMNNRELNKPGSRPRP